MNSKYSEAQAIAFQTPLPSGRVTAAIAIACLVAIASSGYLGWVTLTSSKIAGCGGGDLFNCGHVTSSQWSLWLGIPVSLLAVGLYIGLGTALAAGARKSFSNEFRHAAWAVVSVLAVAAGLAALWFIGLQVFVLQQLCTYCLIAHSCSLIIAGLILYTRPVGTPALKYSSLVSLMGAAVLIGGQLLAEPPKTYRVETFEAPVVEAEVFEFSAPVTPSSTASESSSDEFSFKPISSTDVKKRWLGPGIEQPLASRQQLSVHFCPSGHPTSIPGISFEPTREMRRLVFNSGIQPLPAALNPHPAPSLHNPAPSGRPLAWT